MPIRLCYFALLLTPGLLAGCSHSDTNPVANGEQTASKPAAMTPRETESDQSTEPVNISVHSGESPTGLHWSAEQALQRTNDVVLDGPLEELPEIKIDLDTTDLGGGF